MYEVVFAAAMCVAAMLGGGVIALPYAVSILSPIIGTFVLLFAGGVTLYTGWILGELFLHSEILHPEIENIDYDKVEMLGVTHDPEEGFRDSPNVEEVKEEEQQECIIPTMPPYAMIARESVGLWGECLTYASQVITLVGVDVIFLVLCGINLSLMAEFAHGSISVSVGIMVVAFVSLLMSFLMSDVAHYTPFIWVAVLTTLAGIILRWITIVDSAPEHPSSPPDFSLYSSLEAFGAIAFSFGGHAGFPYYQQNMKSSHQKYFGISVLIAYAYILTLEGPFCITVALLYKGDLAPNFLESLPDNTLSIVILSLFTLHMLTAISTIVPPVAHNLLYLIRIVNPDLEIERKDIALCSPFIVQLVAVIIALTLQENFFSVMALLGNTTITLCTFVLPAVFYLANPRVQETTTLIRQIGCWICITFGTTVGILSIIMFFWNIFQ